MSRVVEYSMNFQEVSLRLKRDLRIISTYRIIHRNVELNCASFSVLYLPVKMKKHHLWLEYRLKWTLGSIDANKYSRKLIWGSSRFECPEAEMVSRSKYFF